MRKKSDLLYGLPYIKEVHFLLAIHTERALKSDNFIKEICMKKHTAIISRIL
jgi:hypothetical protein